MPAAVLSGDLRSARKSSTKKPKEASMRRVWKSLTTGIREARTVDTHTRVSRVLRDLKLSWRFYNIWTG